MAANKITPRSGSSLEAVEPNPQKGAIKFLVFFNIKLKARCFTGICLFTIKMEIDETVWF